jgi:hypothetical protein
MTHDEMTAALRGPDRLDAEDHYEVADRLDRYREALVRITKHDRYGISYELQDVVKIAKEVLR